MAKQRFPYTVRLTGKTAAQPKRCDKCRHEQSDCVKIILAGGAHICLRD